MGRAFHAARTHGRVFHGVEARNMLALHRRDSHGSQLHNHIPAEVDNKMNFIHNNPNARLQGKQNDVAVETVESVVYVTMPQSFEGDAGMSTADSAATSTMDAAASYAQAKGMAGQPQPVTSAVVSAAAEVSTSVNNGPVANTRASSSPTLQTVPTQRTHASSTPIATGPVENTHVDGSLTETEGAARVGGTPLSATHSDANLIASKNEGMSGGATAGLAIGIILAIALAGGLIFFCWRRKKNQKDETEEKVMNEKHGSFFDRGLVSPIPDQRGSLASTRTASTAPRLSLRPVTQFLPNILENRKSAGAANALSVPAMSEKPKSPWERGPAQNPFDDAANVNEKQAAPSNPFDEGDGTAVAAAGRKSPSHSQKSSWEGSDPPTPKSAKFGTAAAVPVNAKKEGPSNVHRVQLEFKPSMEDEIELVSGQLVRMLHEYDDGWALCIRMDRSQQGVCPRTCLSKLPVKRRDGPPPPGPQGRPMGSPPSQSAPRPFTPQGPPNGMVPRPLTPNSQRERSQTMGRNSPAPQENGHMRQRSQSVADGAAVPSRKPVPGMAM